MRVVTVMKAVGTLLATAAFALLAAAAGTARAAGAPAASTGPAIHVSFSSATLTGTLNPRGSETLYYFQYGLTSAYTSQTAILDAGAGTALIHVSVTLSGLAPLTVYHYRLVAVNGAGRAAGGDRALETTRVPLSLQILASPDPVSFGGAVTIQGTLSGTGNGDREVVLQANAFPFTGGFVDVENPELTNAQGGFAFHVLSLTQATQYRVVTTTSPAVISPVAAEAVVPDIGAYARRLRILGRHRRLVRFFGSVTPALDGMHIAIMHVVHGRELFVAGGALRHRNARSSRFSRVLRVRRGVYHVLVQATGGALSPAYSVPLVVR